MAKRHHKNSEAARQYSANPDKSYMRPETEYRQERKDAGMIQNDNSKIANLPTEVMMKAYPECPAYMDWEMEDNIRGIDKQLSGDNAARRRGFSPHKY